MVNGGRARELYACGRGGVGTGEYRGDIGKYTKLRQRLGLDRTQFILCNPDLPDDQLAGLGKMYELTFVNLRTLRAHLQSLL